MGTDRGAALDEDALGDLAAARTLPALHAPSNPAPSTDLPRHQEPPSSSPLLPDADAPSFCPPPLFYQATRRERAPTRRRATHTVVGPAQCSNGARARATPEAQRPLPAAAVPEVAALLPAPSEGGNAEIRSLLDELTRELDFLRSEEFASHVLCHGATAVSADAQAATDRAAASSSVRANSCGGDSGGSGGGTPARLQRHPTRQLASPAGAKRTDLARRRMRPRQVATVHLASTSPSARTRAGGGNKPLNKPLMFRTATVGESVAHGDVAARPPPLCAHNVPEPMIRRAPGAGAGVASHNHRYG